MRMTPLFCFFMTGTANFTPRNTPFTLTAMIRSKALSSISSTAVGHWGTPALAYSTSSRPQRPTVCTTASRLSSARLTSAAMASAWPPAFSICSTVARAASGLRSTTATLAHPADGVPGRPLDRFRVGAAHLAARQAPKLSLVHAVDPGRDDHDGCAVHGEHERLGDLSHVDAHCVRRLP